MRMIPQMRPKARLVLAAAAATALAAAGCGSAGGSSDSGASCTAPGVTPTEIKLGMLYPDTGALASVFRYSRSGVDARMGLANASGGVNGRTVSYEWRDDESDPSVNGEQARLLVEKSNVFGLIMPTAVAFGSAQYLDDQGVPVTGIAAESIWRDHPNMFAFANLAAPGSSVDTFGQLARARGGTRAVVVQDDTSTASSEVLSRVTESLQSQGIDIVGRVTYAGPGSAAEASRQIRGSGADIVVSTVAAEIFADVMRTAKHDGANLKLALNPVGYNPQALAEFGPDLAGATIFTTYLPFEISSPAMDTFRDAMTQYAPELADPNQELAIASYITTDLFLRGLEAAGSCPTRESFISGLRSVSDYAGAGLTPGPIDLKTSSSDLNSCWSFVQVNSTGTAFEPVLNPNGTAQWCGQRLATPTPN